MENKLPGIYKTPLFNKVSRRPFSLSDPTQVAAHAPLLVISNIPEYLETGLTEEGQWKGLKIVRQYPGFLIDLTHFATCDEYLGKQLSRRNRKNLRAKQRKLENQHKISYTCYFGEIEKEEYDSIFDAFYELLNKRFRVKKIYNKNLLKWPCFYKLVYPLIRQKRASLFVIYDGRQPISVTLNFIQGETVFSYIDTSDMSYAAYGLGDISIYKNLEWCLENSMPIFDLSIGETYNKKKWCNVEYNFHHHIFYDRDRPLASIGATAAQFKLKTLQYLRDLGIIGKWFQSEKAFYRLKSRKLKGFNWKEHI